MRFLRVLFSIIAILAAVGAISAYFTADVGKVMQVAEETSADDTAGGDDYEYTEFA